MQEHISNSQEDAKVTSAPKPFDPKDEARMAELEKKFGHQVSSVEFLFIEAVKRRHKCLHPEAVMLLVYTNCL